MQRLLFFVIVFLWAAASCSATRHSVEPANAGDAPDADMADPGEQPDGDMATDASAESPGDAAIEPQTEPSVPNLALMVLIDKSGSMTGAPIELARDALRATVTGLDPADLIGVISFDSQSDIVVPLTPAGQSEQILGAIDGITAGGGTHMLRGLETAYRDIIRVQADRRHVIVLADGQTPIEGIMDLVRALAAEGVSVSAVGLGPSADQNLLSDMATAGGGQFHHTNDPHNLPRIFEALTRRAQGLPTPGS